MSKPAHKPWPIATMRPAFAVLADELREPIADIIARAKQLEANSKGVAWPDDPYEQKEWRARLINYLARTSPKYEKDRGFRQRVGGYTVTNKIRCAESYPLVGKALGASHETAHEWLDRPYHDKKVAAKKTPEAKANDAVRKQIENGTHTRDGRIKSLLQWRLVSTKVGHDTDDEVVEWRRKIDSLIANRDCRDWEQCRDWCWPRPKDGWSLTKLLKRIKSHPPCKQLTR